MSVLLDVAMCMLLYCISYLLGFFLGGGAVFQPMVGGPLCSFSGFLLVISLSGVTLVLRFGDGWFWPCGCLVGFVSFPPVVFVWPGRSQCCL